MQQLLGLDATSEELKSFVDDIGRYHRGEQLTVDVLDDNIADQMAGNNTKLPAELQQSQQSFSVVTNQNNVKNSNKSRNQIQQKSRVPPPARRRSPSRAAEAALLSSTSAKPSSASSKPSPSPEKVSARDQSPFPASATTAPASTTTTTKSRPQRGQRTNPVCGCFGTKHEPLTNCLLCGRISCAIENYDFCPFCSYLLEEIRMDGRYGTVLAIFFLFCFPSRRDLVAHDDPLSLSTPSFFPRLINSIQSKSPRQGMDPEGKIVAFR